MPQSCWKNLYGVLYHPQEVIDLFLQLTLQSLQFPSTSANEKVMLVDFCRQMSEVQEAMKILLPADLIPNK